MRSKRNAVAEQLTNSSSLNDWLTWLDHLDPSKIELGLERIRSVWQKAAIGKLAPVEVIVAGTNGKGSCVGMLENILGHAGYRVGSYTSPHIHHYNERVRINGNEVDDQLLVDGFAYVDALRGDTQLTYFEFGTLAAFKVFADAQLDIVLLEVGLGGRLDAVNLVDADVALVTSIDLDHMDWLGKDRDSIAYEKAGVFRQGKMAICADENPPETLTRHARVTGTPLLVLNRDFGFDVDDHGTWSWWLNDQQGQWQLGELPKSGLGGGVQYTNAAAVLAVLQQLPVGPVTLEAIHDGLATTHVPGRFETLSYEPDIIVDVAHNPQSARALAEHLQTQGVNGQTLAVFGAMADKDLRGIVEPLVDHVDSWYLATPATLRAAGVVDLETALSASGEQTYTDYENIMSALAAARTAAKQDDRIIIFGSFYTVAEAMQKPL